MTGRGSSSKSGYSSCSVHPPHRAGPAPWTFPTQGSIRPRRRPTAPVVEPVQWSGGGLSRRCTHFTVLSNRRRVPDQLPIHRTECTSDQSSNRSVIRIRLTRNPRNLRPVPPRDTPDYGRGRWGRRFVVLDYCDLPKYYMDNSGLPRRNLLWVCTHKVLYLVGERVMK